MVEGFKFGVNQNSMIMITSDRKLSFWENVFIGNLDFYSFSIITIAVTIIACTGGIAVGSGVRCTTSHN